MIRAGDLTTGQCAGLARLVEQAGRALRVASGLAARPKDPVWEPVTVVEWVALEVSGLLELAGVRVADSAGSDAPRGAPR